MQLLKIGFYIQNFLMIITKGGNLEILKLNKYQLEIIRIIKQCEAEKKPIRIIVLKCRQVGISTIVAAYLYFKTATNYFRKSMIIAVDSDTTQNLFDMCKRFYDYSPPNVKPMQKYSNQKKILFANPAEDEEEKGLQSQIVVETANKLTAGRSSTIMYLHMSEFAFWRNAAVVVSGLFQAVPINNPDTAIIIESTANGMEGDGAEFYNRWTAAEDGKSDFIPVFFPWQWNEEYEMPVLEDFKPTNFNHETYGNEGEILTGYLKDYPTDQSYRKLSWRRYKIRNDMGSDRLSPLDQFKQEYPGTPLEAFISSGKSVFNKDKLLRQIEHLRHNEPQKLEPTQQFTQELLENLIIYEQPKEDMGYALAADIAEGLEEGDYSSLTILSKDGDEVAVWHGHIDADLFGSILVELGTYYNFAMLAPEVNNMGIATMATIKRKQYPNVFMRTVKEERSDKVTKKIGWQTNVATKRKMIAGLIEAHRDNLINIRTAATLKEMMTVVRETDGSVVLNSKDRTVALAIAFQCLAQVSHEKLASFVPGRVNTKIDPMKGMSIEDSIRLAKKTDDYYS